MTTKAGYTVVTLLQYLYNVTGRQAVRGSGSGVQAGPRGHCTGVVAR